MFLLKINEKMGDLLLDWGVIFPNNLATCLEGSVSTPYSSFTAKIADCEQLTSHSKAASIFRINFFFLLKYQFIWQLVVATAKHFFWLFLKIRLWAFLRCPGGRKACVWQQISHLLSCHHCSKSLVSLPYFWPKSLFTKYAYFKTEFKEFLQ